MVSKEEYEYTSEWFLIKFMNKTSPIGSNDDDSYSDIDKIKFQIKSNTLVGIIYEKILDQELDIDIINTCIDNFGNNPLILLEQFEKEIRLNIKGVTKGPILARIAPYLLLNDDVRDIIFEFTLNECKAGEGGKMLIEQGCLLVYVDYKGESLERLEMDPYENKYEKFIIVNGQQLALILNIHIDFLKQRLISSIIPNSAILIKKIKQNPILLLKCDETTKLWLFKGPPVKPKLLFRSNNYNFE